MSYIIQLYVRVILCAVRGIASNVYKIYNIVQSNTTIINILFIELGRHVSIPLESSSGPSTKIYRAFKGSIYFCLYRYIYYD